MAYPNLQAVCASEAMAFPKALEYCLVAGFPPANSGCELGPGPMLNPDIDKWKSAELCFLYDKLPSRLPIVPASGGGA